MPDQDDRKPTAPQRKQRERLRVSEITPAAGIDPLIGQLVLDHYVIDALIGSGAMGTVYQGRNVKLDRTVAIKVLHEHLVDDRKMLARFRREAKIAARLDHPNVISVFDCGRARNGREVMVQELAKGPSLAEMIAVAPARRRVIQVIDQILRGLDHAHAAGTIHRDLKPDNIVVEIAHDGTELPRIIDFGIAILRAAEHPYDHRVDLFALGVILYEMLAGLPPFDGSAMEIAVANISREPPPIAKRAPEREVDPLLELYARKLMARRADDRFGSAQEAREVLALLDADPEAARLRMGQTDVARASEVVALPGKPALPRR